MTDRAFKLMRLPLGPYQRVSLQAIVNPGDQLSKSGTDPRVLAAEVIGVENFRDVAVTLMLTEQAQRDLIAALQANLGDDRDRARALIEQHHPEYGQVHQ